MKKLKLSLVIAMLAIVTAASAQMNLGIKGGVNMSNFIGDKASDMYESKVGFNVGLALDYNFAANTAIQSGLFFTTKGANFKDTDKASISLMYLQVPIHLAYKIDVTPGTRIVMHAGPYVAYGVSGNLIIQDEKIDIFKDRTIIDLPFIGPIGTKGANRFDAGLGFGVGAEFGSFVVDLGWDAGLIPLYEDGKRNNMSASLSIGYLF